MKSRQSGLSLIGAILVIVLLGIFLLIGFKTVGPYKEYYSLQRILKVVADEGDNGTLEDEMRRSYERRAVVDGIDESVPMSALKFRKQGGKTVIEVAYERKVPLVANISLLFDFRASSLK
ncbi:MAG: DUF4845 domain-containing protein [Azoarcus sp.]|jgi:hypothetical protein|nr:DUF4845 domain-containing protein [Azoarcus sp.]